MSRGFLEGVLSRAVSISQNLNEQGTFTSYFRWIGKNLVYKWTVAFNRNRNYNSSKMTNFINIWCPISLLFAAQKKIFSERAALLLKIVHTKNGVNNFFSSENIKVFCFCRSNILKFFPIFLRRYRKPSKRVPQVIVFFFEKSF